MLKSFTSLIVAGSAAAFTFAASPAYAGSEWSDRIDLCTAAIDANGVADVEAHKVKFVSGSGGATKKVTLKLTPTAGGEPLIAKCSIKRGGNVSVELV